MIDYELPVSIKTYKVKPKLDVVFPQVYGMKNTVSQHKMNNKILDYTNRLIVKQGYNEGMVQEMIGKYELKTNERKVLSLSVVNYAFTGGAHGLTLMKSLNFDTTTGKNYKLYKLFKEKSDYVGILSKLVEEQIKARNIQTLDDFKGINLN